MADVVVGWYRESHFGPGSALLPVLVLALLALPFLRKSSLFPALVFSWVAAGAAYVAMLVFRDAGAGPHHTVLLDPAPQFIVAASVAALAERWRGGRSAAVDRRCARWWRDRICGCSTATGRRGARTDSACIGRTACRIWRTWCGRRSCRWLRWSGGRIMGCRLKRAIAVNFAADTSPRENVLYVTHCEGYVIDPARAARFEQSAAAAGLHQTANRVVADKKGHLVYCLFQLARD